MAHALRVGLSQSHDGECCYPLCPLVLSCPALSCPVLSTTLTLTPLSMRYTITCSPVQYSVVHSTHIVRSVTSLLHINYTCSQSLTFAPSSLL